MRRLLGVGLALILTGCAQAPPATNGASVVLGGTFTHERTDETLRAWCAIAQRHGNECGLMESFPEQYVLRFQDHAACEEARRELLAVVHVRPGECRDVRAAAPAPEDVEDASPRVPSPPAGPATRRYDVGAFAVTWTDPDEGRGHAMEWEVVRAWSDGTHVVVETTTHGIEGGDFRFTLWFRPREVSKGGMHFHEPDAPSPGTFDFAYTEAIFFAGRPIDAIESVDPTSFVSIAPVDDARGRLEGSFRLEFTGRCRGDCVEGHDPPRRTILDGRFA